MKRTASALRLTALIAFCLSACLLPSLFACSQSSEANGSGDSARSIASPSASEPSPTTWVYEGKDAEYVLNAFKNKGLNVGEIEVYDETTDPNGRLGQDGDYTSKATFIDDRVDATDARRESDLSRDFGGTLEVFENESDCIARQDEVSDAVNSAGGTGDMYVYRYGTALLRIGCELSPSQAEEYKDALLEGADEAQCSKTGMAADGYTPLKKTGKETDLYGLTFSVGEGWSVGNPIDSNGYSMTYLQKGTYFAEQCYISKLEGEPNSTVPTITTEMTKQVLETILASTGGDASEMQAVDVDGVEAWRASAKSTDPDVTWHYTVVPMDNSFVVAAFCVTDDAPKSAVSNFEKSLHLSASVEAAKAAEAAAKAKEEADRKAEEQKKKQEEEAKARTAEELEKAELAQKTDKLEYSSKKAKPLNLVECSDPKVEVTSEAKVDLSELGSKTVDYTLSLDGQSIKREIKFEVLDTKSPQIDFVSKTPKIDVGADYDPVQNINFVKDPVDGELALVDEAPDAQGSKTGEEVFYDAGWYTVDGNIDTSVAGVYSIDVNAADIHGNTAHRTFDVTVVAPEPEPEAAAAGASDVHPYVLNKNKHKFHHPGCGDVKKIKDYNREDVEMSRDEIIRMGYDPCGHCNP